MSHYVGIDIGGTKIAAGILTNRLEIKMKEVTPFPKGQDVSYIASLIRSMVINALGKLSLSLDDISCIGAAVPGSVDLKSGRIVHAHNLGLHDAPLRRALTDAFKSDRILILNDANAAGYAELYAGVLMGKRTSICITLGTGVGSALIINGALFNGGLGNGTEAGHMVMDYHGLECTCGIRGCAETLCSATALTGMGRKLAEGESAPRLFDAADHDLKKITAKLIIDRAAAGDNDSFGIFMDYIDALGSYIASLINVLDPESVAVGGGICNAGDFLFRHLSKNVDGKCFFKNHGNIVQAKFLNDAGTVGAAAAAKEKYDGVSAYR